MIGKAVGFWLVAVLVGVAAIAFGSVETWAEVWLRFGAVAAFAAVTWSDGPKTLLRGGAAALVLPAALLLAWGIVQSLPLPSAVVRALSPRTARLQAETLPEGGGAALPSFLLSRAPTLGVTVEDGAKLPPGPADPGSRAARSSLSINPHATWNACLSWLTPLLLAFAAERLSRSPSTRYRLLWAIAAWTGVLGAIAVAQSVSWNERLMWIREIPGNSAPLGPFVNPNHFAGYVELGVLVVVGLLLAIVSEADGTLSLAGFREAVMDRGWALPRLLVLGFLLVLGIYGLVLSGSRGAAVALFAGGLVLIPLFHARRWLPVATVGLVALGLGVGVASWMGRENHTLQSAFFADAANDASLSMRSDIWGRTWRIVVDHPLTGTGMGTFPSAYASYDREGEWLGTAQTHDDFLQFASETGLVGTVLLGWLIVAYAWTVLKPGMQSGSPRPKWTTAALAAGCFAMLTHSIIEFNLQVPAVACLFAVLVGALAGACAPATDEDEAAA